MVRDLLEALDNTHTQRPEIHSCCRRSCRFLTGILVTLVIYDSINEEEVVLFSTQRIILLTSFFIYVTAIKQKYLCLSLVLVLKVADPRSRLQAATTFTSGAGFA